MLKLIVTTISIFFLSELALPTKCYAKAAQPQTKIQQMADATCAVMADSKKIDARSFQYLLMLEQFDFSNADPISMIFFREVMKTCPKAYLSYQQKKRENNPFPPGSLVKPNPTPLIRPGPPVNLINPNPSQTPIITPGVPLVK
jgi:hypothetical protein